MKTTPISSGSKENFETLLDAARNDRLCLASCFDRVQQQSVPVLCAVNVHDGATEPIELVPLAVFCIDDPYERFAPPSND